MNHLGLDVHSKATVWHLLDETGQALAQGKADTTAEQLAALLKNLSASYGPLRVGQEIGGQSYFVHDVVRATHTDILSFNAHQLRVIAASRKKTDRRDAFWIAKSLQTEMMPHPVYMPDAPIRELRMLVALRDKVVRDGRSWRIRAKGMIRAIGEAVPPKTRSCRPLLERLESRPEGINATLAHVLRLCARQEEALLLEQSMIETELRERAASWPAVKLLSTIPGIGFLTAVRLHAWIGEVKRFPNARTLTAYAGLIPSVRQSGTGIMMGHITREGSSAIRSALVQSAQSVLGRSKSAEAEPLRQIGARIRKNRSRYKIAVVALARHILRIVYYVLRDGLPYDPERLRDLDSKEDAVS